MKKRKKAVRDMLAQGELPFLWPDRNGALHLRPHYRARSSGLQSPRSRLLPRAEVVRASRLQRSQSFVSWLLSKNFHVVGFGTVKESLFVMWLSRQLESCAFGALSIGEVVTGAVEELGFERSAVLAMLCALTVRDGSFKSDGVVISLR